ncbi:MAG: hypothetical protein ABMA26_08695 [Limisphaerales bacterium]
MQGQPMWQWMAGFTAEGPMFWTLVVLLGCLVYMRKGQAVTEQRAKLEAENARRQEQTYQAMVQHYRQVVSEQQMRMDATSHHAQPAPPASAAGTGGTLELFQLLAESSTQKISRLEVRLDTLTKEIEAAKRESAEATAMTAQLLGVVSDMQHKMNNISNAMQIVLEKEQ